MQTKEEIKQEWCLWCDKQGNQSDMVKTNYIKFKKSDGFKQDYYHYTCDANRECVTNNSEYPQ